MKPITIVEILALLLSTGVALVDAECLFCINATIIDPTLEVGGGETCASLSEAAPSLEADEFLCTDVALEAQGDCCPFFNVTTVEEGSIINPTFNETFEEVEDDGSDSSSSNTTTTAAPCSICANGLTVSDNTVIPFAEANGSTCAETLAYAQNILESSDICATMKNAENVCCPEPVSDPCQVCAEGGISVDGSTPIFDGAVKTCADVVVDALTVEESTDVCAQMKLSEATCCSESVVLNATVAPSSSSANDTESVAPTIAPSLNETESSVAPTITPSLNGTLISTATNNETTSNATTTTTTTCEVCLDGITAGNENIVIGEGKTCEDLIVDAAFTDANDVGCSMMQDAQLSCCPTPAEEPCDVCPDGISVEEDTAITVAKTCGDLMVDALNTEAESDICSGMKAVAEPICCPVNATTTTTAPTTAPEMNNSTTTTTLAPSLETLAPSSTVEDANATESLSPTATSTTTSATSSSPESSSSSSSSTPTTTALSVTTPSPSLVATSTDDEVTLSSFSPTSLSPTTVMMLDPSDKEPLPIEAPESGGEAPGSSGISHSSQRVAIFAIAMICASLF